MLGCSPLSLVGVHHLIRFLFYLDGSKDVAKLQDGYGWLNLALASFIFSLIGHLKKAVYFSHVMQVYKIATSSHCTREVILIGPVKLTQKTLETLENLGVILRSKLK